MKLPFSIDLKNILIVVLISILVIQRCTKSNNTDNKQIVKVGDKNYQLLSVSTDTVYIEKTIEIPTYIPKYITKVDTFKIEIPAKVDTLQILKKYFETYRVTDTLQLIYEFSKEYAGTDGKIPNPNIGYGIITDDISQNSIVGRSIIWNYKIPHIKDVTIVKELPKNQLYVGLNTNFSKQNFVNSIGIGGILKTKEDKIYQLNTGLINNQENNIQLYIGGGLYWKIKLKK